MDEKQPSAQAPTDAQAPDLDVDDYALEVSSVFRPLLRSLRLSPRSRDAWKTALDAALKARI